MKFIKVTFFLFCLSILSACQSMGVDTMVLLDEKIVEVEVAESHGLGDLNDDSFLTFKDQSSIKSFQYAITTAVKSKVELKEREPDYDIIVSYGDRFPKHAIHLFLGEEGEESILMYFVDGVDTYKTSAKATNELRALILSSK